MCPSPHSSHASLASHSLLPHALILQIHFHSEMADVLRKCGPHMHIHTDQRAGICAPATHFKTVLRRERKGMIIEAGCRLQTRMEVEAMSGDRNKERRQGLRVEVEAMSVDRNEERRQGLRVEIEARKGDWDQE